MRSIRLLLVLSLVLLPAATALADELAPPPPANLKQLGERLERLAVRIAALVDEANKDPDEIKIDTYLNYTGEELRLKRRSVRAHHLVDFMADKTKHIDVRKKAQDAIYQGGFARGDPDLSLTDKQGRKSKRAYFSEKHLVKHLRSEDDAKTRKLVHELLLKMWRINNNPQIQGYNHNDKKTWKAAYDAWKRFLGRN